MPIEFFHREDRSLQKDNETGCLPESENTFVERVIVPTRKALLKFLDRRVVKIPFENMEALKKVLNEWPEFAKQEGIENLNKGFRAILVLGDTINCQGGRGGRLWLGHIKST